MSKNSINLDLNESEWYLHNQDIIQGLPWLRICCSQQCSVFNYLLAGGHFCRLLITFANCLDPDQARHLVGPDLDPNCLTLKIQHPNSLIWYNNQV